MPGPGFEPGPQLYTLALYQLNHPDKPLGQARMFSLISFPLYFLRSAIVPSVDTEHLLGITFLFKVAVLMLAHIETSLILKIWFSDWLSVGHKC